MGTIISAQWHEGVIFSITRIINGEMLGVLQLLLQPMILLKNKIKNQELMDTVGLSRQSNE